MRSMPCPMALDRPTEEEAVQRWILVRQRKKKMLVARWILVRHTRNPGVNRVEHLRSSTSFGPLDSLVCHQNCCSENLNCLKL